MEDNLKGSIDALMETIDYLDDKPGSQFLPFEEARFIVQALGLRSWREWCSWSKSGKRPYNIPSNPRHVYKYLGWKSWPDWMGYEGKSNTAKGEEMLPFKPARRIVRGIGLRSVEEWKEWSKSGKRPSNPHPGNPHKMYKDAGWTSMPDWMGYEREGAWNKGVPKKWRSSRYAPYSKRPQPISNAADAWKDAERINLMSAEDAYTEFLAILAAGSEMEQDDTSRRQVEMARRSPWPYILTSRRPRRVTPKPGNKHDVYNASVPLAGSRIFVVHDHQKFKATVLEPEKKGQYTLRLQYDVNVSQYPSASSATTHTNILGEPNTHPNPKDVLTWKDLTPSPNDATGLVHVTHSDIHGQGLFATTSVRRGCVIARFIKPKIGVWPVNNNSFATVHVEQGINTIAWHDAAWTTEDNPPYWYRLNHPLPNRQHNCKMVTADYDNSPQWIALQDIQEGEELTFAYDKHTTFADSGA